MKHDSTLFKWVMSQKLQRFKFSSVIIPVGFQRLHRVIRWNAIVPVGLERSVFEHSYAMSKMATEMGLSEDAALKAVLHDVLEIYSGDIQTIFKMFIPDYEVIEKKFFNEHRDSIKNDFFNVADELYLESWEGEEGKFLKFLDHLDGWLEVEDMLNNGIWCPEFERYRYFLIDKYYWIKERFQKSCDTCKWIHEWTEQRPFGSTTATETMYECKSSIDMEPNGTYCKEWRPVEWKE